MKKILLLMSLLILVVGVGVVYVVGEQERIAMLEFRIEQLEVDLLCEDRNSGDALHSRFKVSRIEPHGFRFFCSQREKYLRSKRNDDNFPLDRYPKAYSENKDLFRDLVKEEERESIFEPVYKDWFAEEK